MFFFCRHFFVRQFFLGFFFSSFFFAFLHFSISFLVDFVSPTLSFSACVVRYLAFSLVSFFSARVSLGAGRGSRPAAASSLPLPRALTP
jgi:hypothetical protein